jgi:hypothetical protein
MGSQTFKLSLRRLDTADLHRRDVASVELPAELLAVIQAGGRVELQAHDVRTIEPEDNSVLVWVRLTGSIVPHCNLLNLPHGEGPCSLKTVDRSELEAAEAAAAARAANPKIKHRARRRASDRAGHANADQAKTNPKPRKNRKPAKTMNRKMRQAI